MTFNTPSSAKLRQEFLNFFSKQGHVIVSSSSLVSNDPSVLFTTAGMQQFKPYYLGEKSPYGPDVVSCQKCFRTSDIEEVGDNRHLTFLEMLGNFSFNGYFKEQAIKLACELLISNFQLPISKMTVTVFSGDKEVPRDEESIRIWKKFGFSEEKGNLRFAGRKDNFWGPTGEEGPCGPTTEIYLKNTEIWNLVFNEYYQDKNGKLTPLRQKGVDTGMGLERLAMIVQDKPDVFETDLFEPIIKEIQNSEFKIENSKLRERSERIIADHIKGAVFLAAEGIFPSNIGQGYILRRILRRAIRFGKFLDLPPGFLISLAKKVIEIYRDIYPEINSRGTDILTVIQKEEEKFSKTLERGLREFEKVARRGKILGVDAFHLFDTYGFPLELTEELAKEKKLKIEKKGFEEAFEKHREISRAGVEKKFGGIGKGATYEAVKLHTATHLLHSALREILGERVRQMGSDITPERLRFDFSHSAKMTKEEIKKVESLVNQKIKEDLAIKEEELSFQEVLKIGALAFFKEKYPGKVTVYSIDNFSKETCAGPHVKRTSELGRFRIVKEESLAAGTRRIRAILE